MANKNVGKYIQVHNGEDILTVDTTGAQIVSWVVDGLEVMYQGALDSKLSSSKPEPAWAATAKNLFPNPGPMGSQNDRFGVPVLDENGKEAGRYTLPKEGKVTTYYHNGGVYQMGQHGFAQNEEYKVLSKVVKEGKNGVCRTSGTNVVMTITDELNDTAGKYPYKFAHSIVYDLAKKGGISYEAHAQNNDNKPMVAGQGWHPAFKLHGDPASYVIRIENLKTKDGAKCELTEGQIIKIYDEVISKDASVHYGGIAEADISLYYLTPGKKIVKYLTMHTTEPELILWSRHASQEGQESFIAIEPWNTPSRMISELTTQDKTQGLAKKGAVIVPPAMSASEKQDVVDFVEAEQELSPIEKQCLLEHLQVEDSVLRAKVGINPEYVRYFAPYKELIKGGNGIGFGDI